LIALALVVRVVLVRLRRVAINTTTKTCVVTGASAGIGRQLATEMVKRGWTVIGVARREWLLEELARELGPRFIYYRCDVSDPASVHAVSQEIKQKGLKPTLFFLNAGIMELDKDGAPLLEMHKRTFNTNYFGVMSWVDEWLPAVKGWGGGTFVTMSSVAALSPLAISLPARYGSGAGYSASKAALISCFESLRRQYRRDGVGFTLVVPGPVNTDMIRETLVKLPFTHQPADEARYIVAQVLKGKRRIEPSWLYSGLVRVGNFIGYK
jgi:3-hydroxy acid dehydrogenase / malonic semialdehyde reductase